MKIVYTGGEFLLSAYLNALKIPLVIFLVIVIIKAWIDCVDSYDEGAFKKTYLYRNRYWLSVLAALTNLYLFVFWN